MNHELKFPRTQRSLKAEQPSSNFCPYNLSPLKRNSNVHGKITEWLPVFLFTNTTANQLPSSSGQKMVATGSSKQY
jgi:hypothetical protein